MQRFHVKKNDEVVVLSGSEKGKRGKVISVNGKNSRVIIEGVRMTKKHQRKSQQHPQGAILEREGSIHISNVMKAEAFDARASKRGKTAPAAA
jgi:large subunit ribosomal protein L24